MTKIVKKIKVSKYQKLLKSIDFIKEEFLLDIRNENRNTRNERVGVFIDVQNVYYGAKNKFNGKIDFKKLLKNICRDRRIEKANAYLVNSDIDSVNFVKLLNQLGYNVISKDLKVRGDGSAKGNTDIEMTMDILNLKDNLDTVALVSGDGDFVPLVELLKSQSVNVEVYSFDSNTAYDLKNVSSKFFELNEDYIFEKGKK